MTGLIYQLQICPVCDRDAGVAVTREGERLVARCECGALAARPLYAPRERAA